MPGSRAGMPSTTSPSPRTRTRAFSRGDPKPWLDRLEAEHDNLRAALDHFAETGTGELEQRLAGALWRFWQWRGHFAEGRRRLDRALAADDRPTEARAWALFGAAVLAGDSRDPAASRPLFEQALPLFEELGDAYAGARVRMNLGMIALQEGDLEGARTLSEEAVRAFEELGDEDYVAVSTRNLAWAHWELGDRERARTLHEEVVRRARAIGNVHLEGQALGELAELAIEEGRAEQAVPLLRESTRIFTELADPLQIASNLSHSRPRARGLGPRRGGGPGPRASRGDVRRARRPQDGSVQSRYAGDDPGAARRGCLRRGAGTRRGAHARRGGHARARIARPMNRYSQERN